MLVRTIKKLTVERQQLPKKMNLHPIQSSFIIAIHPERLWKTILHEFSNKKGQNHMDETNEHKKQFSSYRSFNQRILQILYVYILNKYNTLNQTSKSHERRRKPEKNYSWFSGAFKKIFWAIFGGGTIFYAQLQQALFTRMYESLKKRLNQNQEISKGKHIQNKILHDLEAEYTKNRQMAELFTNQLSYFQEIQNIIRMRDFKTLIFIQSFSGNGLGFNLRRVINDRMHKRPLMFQKFYYINLKQPPSYDLSQTNEDENWLQAKQLHYLMNTLIGIKTKSSKPNILVIDEIQVLQHFFDNQKLSEVMKKLIRQINQLQKLKHTKIICICNSKTFPDRLADVLRSTSKLDQFKHSYIGKLKSADLLRIISKRTRYEDLIELQLKNKKKNKDEKQVKMTIRQNKRKFQEIMLEIIKKHDNLGQIFRILKSSGVDCKEYFLKYQHLMKDSLLEYQNDSHFSYNPFYSEEYEYIFDEKNQIQDQIHLPSLKFVQEKSKIISDRIIHQKVNYIKKAIHFPLFQHSGSIIFSKQTAPQLKQQKDLQNAKLYILTRIFENGYQNESQLDLEELAKKIKINFEDKNQLQAYLDLNRDNVLHGLVFNDKSMFYAFQKIKKEKQPPKRKKFFIF